MNIYEMMKQLKGMQRVFEEVKETLRTRKEILERDGVEVVFNGLGEVVSIEVKEEFLRADWDRLRPLVIDLVNQAQARARDMAKEEISRRFGIMFGGLDLGL